VFCLRRDGWRRHQLLPEMQNLPLLPMRYRNPLSNVKIAPTVPAKAKILPFGDGSKIKKK
jgi:hypothetical protein